MGIVVTPRMPMRRMVVRDASLRFAMAALVDVGLVRTPSVETVMWLVKAAMKTIASLVLRHAVIAK